MSRRSSIAWGAVRDDRILRLAIIGQVFVWSIAALVPPPIQAYALLTLKLDKGYVGIPLAALGIGIGLGCLLAGKLSASKVEYGLLPLGALGSPSPRWRSRRSGRGSVGTLILMGLIGVSSGLLFVPLNALLQWRASDDRRGAVIALANVLVFGGMFLGSLVAMGLASVGVNGAGRSSVHRSCSRAERSGHCGSYPMRSCGSSSSCWRARFTGFACWVGATCRRKGEPS